MAELVHELAAQPVVGAGLAVDDERGVRVQDAGEGQGVAAVPAAHVAVVARRSLEERLEQRVLPLEQSRGGGVGLVLGRREREGELQAVERRVA